MFYYKGGRKLLKKIVGILCIIAVLATSFSIVSAEDAVATISAGTVAVDKGTENVTVSLPIMFKGNLKLSSLQVNVNFDNALTLVKFTQGDVLELVEPPIKKSPVVIGFYDATANGADANDGTLATLEFSVPTAQIKDFSIEIEPVEIYAINDIEITKDFLAISGKISVIGDPTDEEIENEPEQVPDAQPDEEPNIQETLTSAERKKDVICLKIGTSFTMCYGEMKSIDDVNPLVVPYIRNDRTMVPLRYISEALGADVLWEEGWDGCIIKKGDKEIEFTFGSADFTVNGKKYTYEAPIEMLYDRTMVPLRFISEHLDCNVYWEPINSAVIIAPADNPWKPERQAEIRATNEMLLSILGII